MVTFVPAATSAALANVSMSHSSLVLLVSKLSASEGDTNAR